MKSMIWATAAVLLAVVAWPGTASGQDVDDRDARIAELERMVQMLAEEVRALRAEQEREKSAQAEYRQEVSEQMRAAAAEAAAEAAADSGAMDWGNFTLGGYGESHFNFREGDGGDQADIHRFVLDFGYDFEDWIKFRAELEVEHGFVNDGDGEIVLEQFYVDLLLSEHANVRVGRFLTPVGLINRFHEPTRFYGVERPSFASSIIPTTWSSDGVGLYGNITNSLTYEAYVANGLDGTGFSALSGIRGGRIKERPSLNDPAVTGRLDFFPFVHFPAPHGQSLRVGASGWHGGLDNGDQGNNPGLSGPQLTMVAADFEYTLGRFELRGEGAYGWIDDAEDLGPNIAEEIAGWYLEPAVRVMPDAWKRGKLKRSDLVLFTRYEDYDTQHETQDGVAAVPGADREEVTTGVAFFLTPNIVFKADYQFLDSDADDDPADQWNLGVGMQF